MEEDYWHLVETYQDVKQTILTRCNFEETTEEEAKASDLSNVSPLEATKIITKRRKVVAKSKSRGADVPTTMGGIR